jgi:hypothetical protein
VDLDPGGPKTYGSGIPWIKVYNFFYTTPFFNIIDLQDGCSRLQAEIAREALQAANYSQQKVGVQIISSATYQIFP